MIYNNPGTGIMYGGIEYTVGEEIFGKDCSAYAGLSGVIIEIRDDEDKKTDQVWPELFCNFTPPTHPFDIQRLVYQFVLRNEEIASLEDIPMKSVVQSPFEVIPQKGAVKGQVTISLYVLKEEWALDCDAGFDSWTFSDYAEARRKLNEKLSEEMGSGCIAQWADDEDYKSEQEQDLFDCWLDGEYLDNHYKLSISEENLTLVPSVVRDIWRVYQNQVRIEEFAEQVDQWDALEELSEEEFEKFISDDRIPALVESKLGTPYWESYTEAIFDAARVLLYEYQKKKLQQNKPEV